MTQKKATFCIAVYNDTDTLRETIANIYETVDSELIDIVVTDDSGKLERKELEMFPEVRLINNKERRGVGYSLDRAVDEARTDVVFPMGCDIRFSGDWFERFYDVVKNHPKSLVCTVTAGLNVDRRFLKGGENHYYGSHILFNVNEANNRKKPLPFREYLECKWNGKIEGNVEPIGAVLGAFYGVNRDWYMKIGGFSNHKTWGSLEVLFSLRSYIHGGDCRIDTKTITGHIFKSASSEKPISHLVYNKLLIAYALLPTDMEKEVFNWAEKSPYWKNASAHLEKELPFLQKERQMKISLGDAELKRLIEPTGVLDE